jgi:DNA-binding transcriptional LysR family regulator
MTEIRLIRSFVCLAEDLNFSRAAEQLNIAQPALSRQIQLLESRLGVLLFHRSKRHVELTSAGSVFRKRCYRLLAELDEAEQEARRVAAGQEGSLSVSFIHSSTYGLMPHILRSFREAYPRVELELYEMTIFEQLAALRNGSVDVAIVRPPIADTSIETRLLESQCFVVALPAQHPFSDQEQLSLLDLSQDDFLLFERQQSPLFYSRVISMCERAGFVPRVAQYATQIHTMVGLVSSGMGVSILPEVATNLTLPNVTFHRIKDDVPTVETCLAWRPQNEPPSLSAFVDNARAVADAIGS